MDKSIGDMRTMGGDSGYQGGYTLSPGDTLGQYKIIRPLGRGGMGEVYEVEHAVLRKRFALKILSAELMARPETLVRFKREAQVMAGLDHPNILAVDEFGETDGLHWLRMPMAGADDETRTLQDMVPDTQGRMDIETWRHIMTHVLAGLAYAHERGVVHRDLKPSNILLVPAKDGDFFPAIADFGLARLVGEDWLLDRVERSVQQSMSLGAQPTIGGSPASGGTSTRSLLGTYEYMSPEQKRGEEATGKSDIYAVGLMAYRLLTGRPPTFKRPSELVPGLDPAWDNWIAGCLEEDADERPSADILLKTMPVRDHAATAGSGGIPPPYPGYVPDAGPPRARKPARGKRKRIHGGWVALGVLALVAIVAGGVRMIRKETGGSRPHVTTPRADSSPSRPAVTPPASAPRSASITRGGPLTGRNGTIADLGLELIWVAPGSFEMGSNDGGNDEKPVRAVTITRGFWMGRTEVTQAQFKALTGDDPSHHSGADRPVDNVSWNGAVRYCELLTEREHQASRLPEGYVYRLPTEAEWEYAAKGGIRHQNTLYSGGDIIGLVAWYSGNSRGSPRSVGTKAANELGLYDMSGNVSEWVHDWYQSSYSGLATTDPKGPGSGAYRVRRGGSWSYTATRCRVAPRYNRTPSNADRNLGFRVVLAAPVQ